MTADEIEPLPRRHWFRAAALAALLYVVIGVGTAALSRSAPSVQLRSVWRLLAWVSSAVIFAAHIYYERRFRISARSAALHTAAAVALATFVLAGNAVAHQLRTGSPRPTMLLAFAIWPILTFIPAFAVAWVASRVLSHLSPDFVRRG